jgi:hypothetical protein
VSPPTTGSAPPEQKSRWKSTMSSASIEIVIAGADAGGYVQSVAHRSRLSALSDARG